MAKSDVVRDFSKFRIVSVYDETANELTGTETIFLNILKKAINYKEVSIEENNKQLQKSNSQ